MKVIILIPEKTETAQATSQTALKERLLTIAKRCEALPLLDRRTPDEILGYDEFDAQRMMIDDSVLIAYGIQPLLNRYFKPTQIYL
jgi:hypothetical protein